LIFYLAEFVAPRKQVMADNNVAAARCDRR
jgi:hypothetical protein